MSAWKHAVLSSYKTGCVFQEAALSLLVMKVDPVCRHPLLGAALVADKIQDTVRDDRRIEQKHEKISSCPGLTEIAEEQIDHEGFLDRAEHHCLETQPRAESGDHHQCPNSKDHDSPVPQEGYAGKRVIDRVPEHRFDQCNVDRDRKCAARGQPEQDEKQLDRPRDEGV